MPLLGGPVRWAAGTGRSHRIERYVTGLDEGLLIRSSGQVVQDRPVVSALWTDVPGLSSPAHGWLLPWQQCWQQLEHKLAKLVAATGGRGCAAMILEIYC
jgi:hypothetical protein